MDALSARLRATLENDARATVVSLDGRSAYDCISRAAFLLKLCDVAPALVPFALALLYGQTSEYHGGTTTGSATAYPKLRDVNKATDPLAPALFALGQHEALRRADYIRSCGRVNRSWRLSMNSMSFCRTIPCTCRLGFLFVFFAPFCTCQGVSASAEATYSVLRRRAQGPHRGPWRLPSTGSCQCTSAKTSCKSGASPAGLHSPASGSSSSDAAMARCRPDQRATQAARAAARSGAGTSRARCPASRRSQVAASAPNRPPTTTPTTTKRQRARSNSGYV